MKKVVFSMLIAGTFSFAACTNKASTDEATSVATSTTEPADHTAVSTTDTINAVSSTDGHKP